MALNADAIDYEPPRGEFPDYRLCRDCRCVVGARVCRRGEYGKLYPRVSPDSPLVRVRETDHIPPRPLVLDPASRVDEALDHFAAAIGYARRLHVDGLAADGHGLPTNTQQ
ncbi:hypothetical protein [Mycobacteroides abscessus]|uniref:hypothetical protein n=1 Tax=Mycobacteroides abscessus TaxID=36809 RepID=UPI0009263892|nr:hypothetical protein [Mycobacteroides abscessus]SIM78799.1 Uncharacterised protein [Mycobacteroides abscessus subsp. abscessus]